MLYILLSEKIISTHVDSEKIDYDWAKLFKIIYTSWNWILNHAQSQITR